MVKIEPNTVKQRVGVIIFKQFVLPQHPPSPVRAKVKVPGVLRNLQPVRAMSCLNRRPLMGMSAHENWRSEG